MFDTDPFSDPPGADLDPFAPSAGEQASRRGYQPVWLRTRAGIEFIDVFAGEGEHKLVFLIEQDRRALWNVGSCSSKTVEGGKWEHQDQTYENAKILAETLANALSVDAGGNAPWRFSPPSGGQLSLIERIGLDLEVESKGGASDVLNTHFGSKVLDPVFM